MSGRDWRKAHLVPAAAARPSMLRRAPIFSYCPRINCECTRSRRAVDRRRRGGRGPIFPLSGPSSCRIACRRSGCIPRASGSRSGRQGLGKIPVQSFQASSWATSCPLSSTWPSLGRIRSRTRRKKVVLPAPLLPTKPKLAPLSISSSGRSRTVARP